MALSQEIKDITDVIARDLSEGRASRQSLGAKTEAFGWVGGLPITLASFVETFSSESLTFPITKVTASATPVGPVAPGAVKPEAVVISADSVTLVKFAGQAKVQLEQVISDNGLLPAIQTVLGAGALLAFETSAMATLDADSGGTATGTDWAAALAAGQAAVLGAGGVPSVVVVSHLDYGALIGDIVGSAGFATDPASAVGSYLGSQLHISPKLAAGKAFVLDRSSVVAIQHKESPVVTVDPYSLASTNEIKVVADLFATVEVLNPAHVVETTIGV